MKQNLTDSIIRPIVEQTLGTEYNITTRTWIWIGIITVVAILVDFLCRKVIIPAIKKIVNTTKVTWDDCLLSDNVLNSASHIIPSLVVYILLPFAFREPTNWYFFLMKVSLIYIIATSLKLVFAFLSALYQLSNQQERLKNHHMKGVFQMLKIIVFCLGTIGIVSVLIDKSPIALLTGLGAAATVLMLVFKDTIVGLVAGVQLSANDMLRPGDWIQMDKAGVNGVVFEVTLTTVKVRNWDNTIVTVPPYTLVSDSFQNWRGMSESGGRRVKRYLNIDMNSIRFCTPEELKNFITKGWLTEEDTTPETTNMGVFRKFMGNYLRNHPLVNTELTLIVRQLQPTAQGLPLELYFFSADKNWVAYEHLQADVFDYMISTLPQFGLRVFQSPSGVDLQKL